MNAKAGGATTKTLELLVETSEGAVRITFCATAPSNANSYATRSRAPLSTQMPERDAVESAYPSGLFAISIELRTERGDMVTSANSVLIQR